MLKILSSADWHVSLYKKKIPYEWQANRFKQLFEKLRKLERNCNVHIISGDLFDKIPTTDEIALLLSYLNTVTIPTLVINGNHEATTKGKTFWSHFKLENSIKNPLVRISVENERIELEGQIFQTFPYSSVQTDKLPEHFENDILVTHIRGEVPPHITEEYDFEKLRPWKLVLLGDLHFRHKYKDYNIYYPGSPINTTFDRDNKKHYGVDIIYFNSIDDYEVEFVDLELPKLIRKTVSVGTPMTPGIDDYIVYEVTGTIDQLAKIEKNVLLDKKMVEKPTAGSTLDLKDKTIKQELELYLDFIKVDDKVGVINIFNKLGIT